MSCLILIEFSVFRYKLIVADAIIEHLNPIREKIEDYMKNPDFLHTVLTEGSDKARAIAEATMDEVKLKVGMGQYKEFAEISEKLAKKTN